MSTAIKHKRQAPTADAKVVAFRPVAHFMHPDDLRTALCGAKILGIPSFEPFQICVECQVLHATGDCSPLPSASERHGGVRIDHPNAG